MSQKIAPLSAHKVVCNLDEAGTRRFFSSDPHLGRDEQRYPVNARGFEAIPEYEIATKPEIRDSLFRAITELTYPRERARRMTPSPTTQLGDANELSSGVRSGSTPTVVPDSQIYPFRVNAALLVSIPGSAKPFTATGWFIGPYAVVTAGHVVHPFGEGGYTGWVSSVEVIPGLNGMTDPPPFGKTTSVRFLCPIGWEQDRDPRVDYAVVLLSQGLGSIVGNYGYATYSDNDLHAAIANLGGYPVVAPDGSIANGKQYYSAGPIQNVDGSFVYYDLGTQGGDSGACVYRNVGTQSYAMAVHTGGGDRDRGVRIIEPVYQNFQQWASMRE